MKILQKDVNNDSFDASIPPALKVARGELFQLKTASFLTSPEPSPVKSGTPPTGPVYVEGAKAGLTLRVDIIKLDLTAGKGAINALPGRGAFGERIIKPVRKVVTYDDEYVNFSDMIKVPLRPMIGKIGVAPGGAAVISGAPGPHGGNMDINDIKEGSGVYFPIFVDGAMLSCGDVHAAMGDGESALSGVETEASITLRCHVMEDIKLTRPLVVTANEIMTVGEGPNLEEAYGIALDQMVQLVSGTAGLSFVDSAMLVSIAADLRINQIVNVKVGVRVALPLSILPSGIFHEFRYKEG